jgi:hypothetical protein
MSVTTAPRGPRPGPESEAPESGAGEDVCAHCGAGLARDQEWCLECGSARTLIHRPPDWRVPIAIVGVVVLLVLAGFAIALINLSTNANRSAQTVAAKPATTRAVSTPAAGATAKPATIAGWPTGLSGWTVVLAQRRRQARAENVARLFAGAGVQVGVLHSSNHPLLVPGYWIVFSGRYPTEAAARAAAANLRASGHRRAIAREVAPPGGI